MSWAKRAVAITVGCAVHVVATSDARADGEVWYSDASTSPPTPTPPPPPAPLPATVPVVDRPTKTYVGYGWSTFLADAAGFTAVVFGKAHALPGLTIAGATLWTAATPVLHGMHGNPGRALASGFFRLLPFALVASSVSSTAGYEDIELAFFAGIPAGILTLVDAAIAWEEVPPPRPQTRSALRFAVEPPSRRERGARAAFVAAF